MKFAVCSEVFGSKKWEDVCAFCAKTGFDGIEVASISFAQSVLDIKAASNDVRPVDKTIRLFGPYIKHVHTNDPTSKAAGFGTLDYKPIMKALKEINYQGIVSLEPFKYEPDPETVAEVSLKYLKFCMEG